MSVRKEVQDLIERFDDNREEFRSPEYKERRVRGDFIDPLLEALGWDVHNLQRRSEVYREVVEEDVLKTGRGSTAPDYGFYIGGEPKFFLEAKKPFINIKGSSRSAAQLRSYGWTAKLPLSILTDFEEFAIYDCRFEPVETDRPDTALHDYFEYDKYIDKWQEIAELFSRDAVLKGSLDEFAIKEPRGTATVDDAFLKQIESWREALARNLALRNPTLTQRQLNYAVQMTIDRIIFLRMAEGREAEDYGQLSNLTKRPHVYERLCELFREADDRYNSGLFHFRHERSRAEEPDDLTLTLNIDDDVLTGIIRGLYYPVSPYAFGVLPVEVLGQVYEQFLGKIIRLENGHKAVVEEKPEIRKAGGVYYTPTYVVDYIVKNTVGKLLEGKTPQEVSKLKIVDPACGSGSFLAKAYQCLLNWHLNYYIEDGSKKYSKKLYQGRGGRWMLTIDEKKNILLNNIYGVDIDPQAVEVTKLSLLLEVLEGETQRTLEKQLFRERALPDLDNNTKWGNSLIGFDFYDGQEVFLSHEEGQGHINAFDWKAEFPQAFTGANPGFDAVIGNPPYLNIDDTWGKGDARQGYIKRAYPHIYNDKTDILFYFLAKAVEISRGEVGFIVSRAFLEAYKANRLRAWLSEHSNVREIVDFQNYYVFGNVGITTAVVLLNRDKGIGNTDVYQLQVPDFLPIDLAEQKNRGHLFRHITVDPQTLGGDSWSFAGADDKVVIEKLDAAGETLGSVLAVGQGMQTGRNNVFGKLDRSQIDRWGLPEEQHFIRARNSDIDRYNIRDSGEYLLYLEDAERYADLPKGVQEYLEAQKAKLTARAAYQRGDCEWWRYTWPLHKDCLGRAKLYCPYLATHNRFALDEQRQYLGLTDTTVLYDADQPEDLKYLMGLLNSRLLTFRFRFIGKLKSNGILEYFWNSISKLPIRRIDFSNPSDKHQHAGMVELVERMLSLHEQLAEARTSQEKTLIRRYIDATDRQIDRLVYELYALTEEEIEVVEGDGAILAKR